MTGDFERKLKAKRRSATLSDYLYPAVKMPKPFPPILYDRYGFLVNSDLQLDNLDHKNLDVYLGRKHECERIDDFNYEMEKEQKDKEIEWSLPKVPEVKYESMESRLERLGYYNEPKKDFSDED